MSEVIVITSGKGGVGKTTTVANIGTGLAAMGKKVAVVDTDIGLRNLDVVMGLENRIVYNLVDVINGSCRLKQALIRDRRHSELYLLPSAQTKDKTAVSPEQMIKLTDVPAMSASRWWAPRRKWPMCPSWVPCARPTRWRSPAPTPVPWVLTPPCGRAAMWRAPAPASSSGLPARWS